MNKGSTRLLIMVGLVALLAASWYMLFSETQKDNNEYGLTLKTAREKADLGLSEVALEYYMEAMEYRDSIELRDEVAQFYMDHLDASNYESFCEKILEDYPEEAVGYERLARLYQRTEAYLTCFSIMDTAEKRGIQSKEFDAIKQELAYTYELLSNSAVAVDSYSSGLCAVQRESGLWGYVSNSGKVALSSAYLQAAPFTSSGLAAVQLKDETFALIDTTGVKISVDPEGKKIEACGALLSDKMAVKYNGKYHYCDSSFKELFGEYDYAGAFYCGVAAVQKGGKWAIVDESGKQVTDYVFEDIKMDDKGIAFRGDRAIAKRGGKYMVIDTTGKQVGSETWEDADAFNSDLIAAVKKNGKWGFTDANGKVVATYQYKNAKSFANGMAAVQVGDLWGYIDSESYELQIEAIFDDAGDFATRGNAFVKEGEEWSVLRIYRLW